jgi:hypothetical protein
MATIPPEDQELIDRLNRVMSELYDQEEMAARSKNESLRRAAHHQISLIRGLIKSVVDFHINSHES